MQQRTVRDVLQLRDSLGRFVSELTRDGSAQCHVDMHLRPPRAREPVS